MATKCPSRALRRGWWKLPDRAAQAEGMGVRSVYSKEHIIDEIRRTAEANGGKPLGTARFQAETGIAKADWEGKLWARWSDAVVEAGFRPNTLRKPRDRTELLECLGKLTREIARVPTKTDIQLKGRSEPGFPSHNTFAKFGTKQALTKRLREFANERGWDDVVALCDEKIARSAQQARSSTRDESAQTAVGYVYLLKSGRYYKIGRSNAVGRRERELQIQLPEKAEVVHEIKTDDPVGIESYWHNRFADRRKNGEWFELTANDVAAFKRRKFQ